MTEDLDARRRRAAYRATHRGTKEMDALLGRYAIAKLPNLDGEALGQLEQFLAMPDPTLQGWIFAENSSDARDHKEFNGLVAEIRDFHGLSSTRAD